MKRWAYFSLCLFSGGVLLVAAWLIPVYLRAVDANVLQRAGQGSPDLVTRGLAFLRERKPGVAELMVLAAEQEKISGHDKLRWGVKYSAQVYPALNLLGGEPRLRVLREMTTRKTNAPPASTTNAASASVPFNDLIVQSANRPKALILLQTSKSQVVKELLQTRSLTNTVIFAPSKSSAGQAFDAALLTAALLVEGQHLRHELVNALGTMAREAVRSGETALLERTLMDFLSLGQRLNWTQLTAFCDRIERLETLHDLAELVRNAPQGLPIIFSAVVLSGDPNDVAQYLGEFPQTGLSDLAASLRYGGRAVKKLAESNQRLQQSSPARAVGLDLALKSPGVALALKWLMFLGAGYLLASAIRLVKQPVSPLERPLRVRGWHVFRELLFALGFLFVVLLLSEPFLAQESQGAAARTRLLPTLGSAVTSPNPVAKGPIMNQFSLLTLLLFFVLQALLYVACLVKLAEIRRQNIASRVKLVLLENEEHLFDAGLYLGFAGTIISLILVSMGIIKPSLMAAYSSTSFGVIFVSVFKIFHLRPYRRTILLEVEAARTPTSAPEHKMAAPL